MGRIMALDLGDMRTGVAVSDVTRSICAESFIIREGKALALADTVANEAEKRGVDIVVIGHQINMNGTLGPRALKAARFQDLLSYHGLNIVMWDERCTTVEAERILISTGNRREARKKKIDAVAASLILESYLSRLSAGSGLFPCEKFSQPDQPDQDAEPDTQP